MSIGMNPIPSLQMQLAIHRRTVAYLEEQRAHFGALTPIHVRHQLDETRQQIAQLKVELHKLAVEVDEQPDDYESDRTEAASAVSLSGADALRAYYRTMVDRLSHMSLNGLTDWRGPALPRAELYVERTLAAITHGAPVASLAALLADRHTRLLIEAEPGGGKTTALKRLALACAALALGDTNHIGLFPRPLETPLIPLLLAATDLIQPPPANSHGGVTTFGLWEMIEHVLRRDGLASVLPTLEHALRLGNCLVLIDGLDDISDSERGRLLTMMLGRFVARYPDSRYVITCRNLNALPLNNLFGFSSYSLPPLVDTEIDTLVERYYPQVASHTALTVDDIDAQVARVRGHIRANDRLHMLAGNPLGATLCVLAEAEGHALPQARGTVYTYMIDLLLDGWERLRTDGTAPSLAQLLDIELLTRREARLNLVQSLALAFQTRPELEGDTPVSMRDTEIEPWLRESLLAIGIDGRRAVEQVIPRLLAWMCRQGLLAVDASGSEYAMPWRALREYLAARTLARQPDFPSRAYALAAEPRWRETLLLATRTLSPGPARHTAREFLRLLLETPNSGRNRLSSDPLLAAECLLEFEITGDPEAYMHAETQERLQEITRMPECATAERVRAGLLLGRLGDPRFDTLLPPLVRVPAGPFLFGSNDGYEDEGPQQWVDVPAFAISMFPVTNREYARFLEASPEHPPPKYWYDHTYNNAAQPVVGVTWNDANDYCRWLTPRLYASGVLPSMMVVRLPLEVEWEKAASWDVRRRLKRRYPWGEQWKPGAANTIEGRGTWVTAPAGCYPLGMSPYGAHDMIGNVWEWTASEYASYPDALAPFHESGAYTLRGSSCASLPNNARSTYRSRLPANYWRYHLSFRIVLGRSLAALAEQ